MSATQQSRKSGPEILNESGKVIVVGAKESTIFLGAERVIVAKRNRVSKYLALHTNRIEMAEASLDISRLLPDRKWLACVGCGICDTLENLLSLIVNGDARGFGLGAQVFDFAG